VSAGELARYALVQGDLNAVIQFARESQSAAGRANDHLHLALALAFEGQALDRQGHHRRADRCFQRAVTMLIERQAAGKLAEVGAAYADVLRARGELDRAFTLMRLMADRDFSKLPAAMAFRKK
jgi:tetratricopeptide (TPR) repeat protein